MPTNDQLAKRWLASPRWGGWRVGMVDTAGRVCLDGGPFAEDDHGQVYGPERLPDLSHPGTRAFLLEDVRRAWGEPGATTYFDEVLWDVRFPGQRYLDLDEESEAEALVAALEAAPHEE